MSSPVVKFFVLNIVPLPDCECTRTCERTCVRCVHLFTVVCVPMWRVWCDVERCYCYWDPFLGAGGRGRRNTWMTLDSSTPTSPRSYTNSKK